MESYRTKRGDVVFGAEKILFEESYLQYFRNLYRDLWENGGFRQKGFFATAIFAYAYTFAVFTSFFFSASFSIRLNVAGGIIGIMLVVWLVQKLRGFTTEQFIDLEDIEKVSFVEGQKWVASSRFVVSYGDGKKRYVTMPSSIISGVEQNIEEVREEFESREIEVV